MTPVLRIITCSTRPGRAGPTVAAWVAAAAEAAGGFVVETADLAALALPLLDEPAHPVMRDYRHDHTKRWSEVVSGADALIFVTPEYDFFPPASVVNAVQYLFHEWAKRPVGIVSYGGLSGGLRATQVLRGLFGNVGAVALPQSVALPFFRNQIVEGAFQPTESAVASMTAMLKELAVWAGPLKAMRG